MLARSVALFVSGGVSTRAIYLDRDIRSEHRDLARNQTMSFTLILPNWLEINAGLGNSLRLRPTVEGFLSSLASQSFSTTWIVICFGCLIIAGSRGTGTSCVDAHACLSMK